jgi:hypothetical protein
MGWGGLLPLGMGRMIWEAAFWMRIWDGFDVFVVERLNIFYFLVWVRSWNWFIVGDAASERGENRTGKTTNLDLYMGDLRYN